MAQRKPTTQAQFSLIQLSLIFGPLMLLGVTWLWHAQGQTPLFTIPSGVQYAFPVICILALSGIMVVKRRRAPITENMPFMTMSLIGWAIGEGAALLGVLYYYGTNDPTWAITGILVQLFGMVVLPAKFPQQ